jgi:hypothetical protein
VAANVAKWGVGALAIDASRIGHTTVNSGNLADNPHLRETIKRGKNTSSSGVNMVHEDQLATMNPAGRWPANVILDEEAGAMLDAQTGTLHGHGSTTHIGSPGAIFGNARGAGERPQLGGDSGGASRFLYCAKASREERELGCDAIPHKSAAEVTGSKDGQARLDSPRTGAGRTGGARNGHPTVKPVDLMRYLARLIMPPSPGKLLVPFAGSGSEMIGALLAGWSDVTGIEREAEYVAIARARVALAVSNPRAFEAECERAAKADARQLDMFDRTGS